MNRRGLFGALAGAIVGGAVAKLAPALPPKPAVIAGISAWLPDAFECRVTSYATLMTQRPGWNMVIRNVDADPGDLDDDAFFGLSRSVASVSLVGLDA